MTIGVSKKDAIHAIKEVERDHTIPSKSVFSQKIFLDRVLFHKLKLMGFVNEKPPATILRSATVNFIREFEGKNGHLVQLARNKIIKSNKFQPKPKVNIYSLPEA
ncbi:hypothetical protein [uncultured Methanobacterium sp.]|uniref:hypothetical protein n=1 Tax=uncultured Methanobacterium sp. TaxID=176306 RepID=UPI002AA67D82|nr:hypothetical protein [uncultured Methanobacterium sp.]